ncbi:MAG TPA: ElyC/SanA/YdcF family protein [Candidatus Saccharimonadales bacterium]
MKTILFINGGKVEKELPSQRFRLRLEWAIEYFRQNHKTQDITFFISGRWGRVTENFLMTEAEVGKQFILQELPDAKVIKEDISVELIGNYAFSKPLIKALTPDNVIIITSDILKKRVKHITKRVFAEEFAYEYHFIQDELSGNAALLEKDAKALNFFRKLFSEVSSGNDHAVREILFYKTPYYFKGIVDDKAFFETYWEGGFASYIEGITIRNNK